MLLAAHALVETYSVLTRLPAPLRLSSAAAERLIRQGYVQNGEVVALGADGYLRLLAELPASGIAGGRTYDAVIAATARAAGAESLLTFNARDFAGLVKGVDVRAPSGVV